MDEPRNRLGLTAEEQYERTLAKRRAVNARWRKTMRDEGRVPEYYEAQRERAKELRQARDGIHASRRVHFKVCRMCGNCERRSIKECQRCESRMFREPTQDEGVRLADRFPPIKYRKRDDEQPQKAIEPEDRPKRARPERRSYRFVAGHPHGNAGRTHRPTTGDDAR